MPSVFQNLDGQAVPLQSTANVTVEISSVHVRKGDPTIIDFETRVIGALGIVNVTIPKSISPSNAIALVFVNGTQDQNQRLTSDSNNYYSSLLVPFGTYSIEIQLSKPALPFLEYVAGGAIAAGILVMLVLVFSSRRHMIRIRRFHNA